MSTNNEFHQGADMRPVTILRTDAIDAAGALLLAADESERRAKSRRLAGPHLKSHRAWLRSTAKVYRAAAGRVQRAADDAFC